jgi:broad specificity phosphatase PhoE
LKIYLVRHCETDHNRDGVVQGRSDLSLNATGRRQAAKLAGHLSDVSLDAVFSSPLRRAVETATAIATTRGQTVVIEPDLVELDVGEMDGLTGAQMRERFPEFFNSWLAGPGATIPLPGGESLEDVQERGWCFLEKLRGRGDLEQVACVTHHFVLLSLICRAVQLPLRRIRRIRQPLGSFSVIEFRGERIQILRLNETCHLRDAPHLVDEQGRC